jgi:hypothetical protein
VTVALDSDTDPANNAGPRDTQSRRARPRLQICVPRVELESLDGIIGVAIDSNRRTVESDKAPSRYVVVDGVTHVFEWPAVPTDPAGRRV